MFVIVFLEKRCSFQKNLKLALGIKRVTHNSPAFYRNSKTKNNKNYKLQRFCLFGKFERYRKQERQHWYSLSIVWYSQGLREKLFQGVRV